MRDDGTLVLDWVADEPTEIRSARFELHEGMVVAIRATYLEPSAVGDDRVEASEDDVWAIAHDPAGGAQLAWIARNCPNHSAELEHLLEEGSQALLVPAAFLE